MRSLLVAFAACALGGACSSSSPTTPMAPLTIPAGCQPLAPDVSCTLPFPSDYFFDGQKIALTGAAKPVSMDGKDVDVTARWAADGASRQPTIAAVIPSEIVGDGLPNINDEPVKSTELASPTLLLRADTGEAIPHYVDLDPRPDDPAKVVINVRPHVQLAPKTRYVIALKGVRAASGLAPAAEGFRRLRDKQTTLDPALASLAPRFESDVFGPLEKKGVQRKELQLAWDFTTGSIERPTADLVRVRELTLEWLKTNTPEIKVSSATSAGPYWRVVRGTIKGPLYLDKADPGAMLQRDARGAVVQNGETTFPFVALVPETVRDQWDPGRALAFGHGFFGTLDETDGLEARDLLPALKTVTFAIDYWGMSAPDRDAVVEAIAAAPARAVDFVERTHQAFANWMVTTAAIKGPMTKVPELARPMSGPGTSTNGQGMSNAGALLYDPARVHYFGASNGHILGGVLAALDPNLERAVLNVGGAAWTHMIPRALPFVTFQFILLATLRDRVALFTAIAMLAPMLDRIDPASYAGWLLGGSKLPGSPDRKVLMQIGVGDASVPNVGSFFHARMLGLSHIGPAPYPLWGIPSAEPATLSSGLLTFDYGIPPTAYRDPLPLNENRVHGAVRHDPQAIAQMDAFFDGKVIQPCGGAPCKGK